MTMPEIRTMDMNIDPAVPANMAAGQGVRFDARQMSEKGYDIVRGGAAAFTADLEGSVAGQQWAIIVGMGVTAQGPIPAHYNYLRVNCSLGGALDGSVLKVAGKVL